MQAGCMYHFIIFDDRECRGVSVFHCNCTLDISSHFAETPEGRDNELHRKKVKYRNRKFLSATYQALDTFKGAEDDICLIKRSLGFVRY